MRSILWNTSDYLLLTLATLLATPLLIHAWGLEVYGIWVLMNTVIETAFILGMGLNDSAIKTVAERERHSPEKNTAVIQTLWCLGLIFFAGLSSVLFVSSSFLALQVFHVNASYSELAQTLFQWSALQLFFRSLSGLLSGTLKGFERFDRAAQASTFQKVGSLFVTTGLAFKGFNATQAVTGGVLWQGVGWALHAGFTIQMVGVRFLVPRMHSEILRELRGFLGWSSLLNGLGSVQSQIDKLLVGSLLGAEALGLYHVGTRLAQVMQNVLNVGSSILFPKSSRLAASGQLTEVRALYERSLGVTTILATLGAISLYFTAPILLRIWVGEEMAAKSLEITRLLALGLGGVSLTSIPYYLLNGLGKIRLNISLGLTSSALIALVLILGLPRIGIMAAGWAQVLNYIVVLFALAFIHKKVFHAPAWTGLRYGFFYAGVTAGAITILNRMIQ